MTCPGIDELLAGAAAEHARDCQDCSAVLALAAARSPEGCGLAEALMAAHATGEIAAGSERLLRIHLARCASCALVAGSLEAPAMTDAFATAVALERSFDRSLGGHGEAVPGRGAERPAAPAPAAAAPRRRRVGGRGIAAIALIVIAALAALVTRALG